MTQTDPPADSKIIDPQLLLLAYRSGVFPMADARDDPEIMWIEPRERAIIPLQGLRVSRSLGRTLRRERFRVTCDAAFAEVVDACAAPRPAPATSDDESGNEDHDTGESWISHRIAASYNVLHRQGHAHSIECWQNDRLVGGLYGVAFNRVFCGESMFSRVSDASKVALCWLVAAMRASGMELLDCQFMTAHLDSMGAIAMPQSQYLELVRQASRPGGDYGTLPGGYSSVVAASSSPGKSIAQSLTQTS